eukprot:m51a1_g6231 putative C-tail anchored protein, putative N-terminal carbohydrate binding domain (611) ;mRNA; f:264759-266916
MIRLCELCLLPLLAACCAAWGPWTCESVQVVEDVVWVGTSLGPPLHTVSHDQCKALCCSRAGCGSWSFTTSGAAVATGTQCTLRAYSGVPAITSPGVLSGRVRKDYGPRNMSTATQVGCFGSSTGALLSFAGPALSATMCREYCASLPAAFSGSSNGHECRCGDSHAQSDALPAAACVTPCGLNASEVCGGASGAASVWRTGYAEDSTDPASCLPQPWWASGSGLVDNDTAMPLLKWAWTAGEWNSLCWCYEWRVVFFSGPAFPAVVAQSLGIGLAAGNYTAALTMSSARPGDSPRTLSSSFCVPAAPEPTAMISPANGSVVAAQGGAVTLSFAVLAPTQWGASGYCPGAAGRPAATYDVFVGSDARSLRLRASVPASEAIDGAVALSETLRLGSGAYAWLVVPNNGQRRAHGLAGDLLHPARLLVVRSSTCGNGAVEAGEQCDSTAGCSAVDCSCYAGWHPVEGKGTCRTVCGDGVAAGLEECDTGSNLNGSCLPNCVCDTGYERQYPLAPTCVKTVDWCNTMKQCEPCLKETFCGWCGGLGVCMMGGLTAPAGCSGPGTTWSMDTSALRAVAPIAAALVVALAAIAVITVGSVLVTTYWSNRHSPLLP